MPSPESPQAIIVLGSGVTPNNRPGFDGKIRMLALLELLKTSTPEHILLTGGQIAGKSLVSEAEAMQTYLLKEGPVKPKIFLEPTATDTIDNIRNSALLLQNIGNTNIQIVTNLFHKPRVELICRNLKFPAEVISAEDILINRSRRHSDLLTRINASDEMKKKQDLEVILIFLTNHTWGRTLLQLLAKKSRI